MRTALSFVLLLLLLSAGSAHAADVVGLGVGASSANVAIVRIEGQPVNVTLTGVPDASEAARSFLQCLIAGRVVHVDVAHGRVTMLDGNSANDHVLEYLQTKTTVDPCALGKASYVRGATAAPATTTATAPAAGGPPAEIEPRVTSEALPQPAPAAKPAAKKRAAKKPAAKKH
jgi:hypothetical protein